LPGGNSFVRPPECQFDFGHGAAAENFVWHYLCQLTNRHTSESFVTSSDCIASRLLICSAALSGQSPEATCGAPKARGLTASTNVIRLGSSLFYRISFHSMRSRRGVKNKSEAEIASGRGSRATALYSVDLCGSNHDAVMRIVGEAPGSGPNLHSGFLSHGFYVGSPLPRIHRQT
jgi:hypothetical protein